MNSTRPIIGLYQPYPHTFGGTQKMVLSLARTLPAFGCEPLVISPEAGSFTRILQEEQIPCLISDPGPAWHLYGRGARSLSYLGSPRRLIRLFGYWRSLSRQLARRTVSILHCNDYRGVMLAAPAARLARIPALWHMHGFIPSPWANVAAALLVQQTVPVSRGMLDYLALQRQLFRRCRIIHNGLQAPATPNTATETAPAGPPPGPTPLVLAVGALHPRKSYETLIQAFKEVADRIPGAACWIAGGEFGDATYARQLRDQVQRLGLNAHVRFLGHASQVPALLQQCTLLAIPSRIEAFGMVALEAMAAGKPVVASRTGGLPEIVLDGQTGRLVEPGRPALLARTLVELLTCPELARRMGQAGLNRVREQFSLERMAASFAELYRALLHPSAASIQPKPRVVLCPSLNRN